MLYTQTNLENMVKMELTASSLPHSCTKCKLPIRYHSIYYCDLRKPVVTTRLCETCYNKLLNKVKEATKMTNKPSYKLEIGTNNLKTTLSVVFGRITTDEIKSSDLYATLVDSYTANNKAMREETAQDIWADFHEDYLDDNLWLRKDELVTWFNWATANQVERFKTFTEENDLGWESCGSQFWITEGKEVLIHYTDTFSLHPAVVDIDLEILQEKVDKLGKEFIVTIEEILAKDVVVKAKTREEAQAKALKNYYAKEDDYILDAWDFQEVKTYVEDGE